MNPKPVIIACGIAVLFVATVYFVGSWYYGRYDYDIAEQPEPQTVVTSPPTLETSLATSDSDAVVRPPTETPPNIELSKEEADRLAWAEIGLEPPPEGYHYMGPAGEEFLWPLNEPYIEVWYSDEYDYGQFYQLTEEEHVRYIVLEGVSRSNEVAEEGMRTLGFSRLAFVTYPEEVIALAKERVKPLYEKTYGPYVTSKSMVGYDRPKTETDRERESRLMEEKEQELEPRLYHHSEISDAVRKEIITELFSAAGLSYQQYLDDQQAGYPKMN